MAKATAQDLVRVIRMKGHSAAGHKVPSSVFTPLESPAIYDGDAKNK